MDYHSPKISVFSIVVSILFALIKLFTSIIFLPDDPTKFFVIRFYPSFSNEILATQNQLEKYVILVSDENSLVGETLYLLITDYLWWLTLIFVIVVTFSNKKHKNKSGG